MKVKAYFDLRKEMLMVMVIMIMAERKDNREMHGKALLHS